MLRGLDLPIGGISEALALQAMKAEDAMFLASVKAIVAGARASDEHLDKALRNLVGQFFPEMRDVVERKAEEMKKELEGLGDSAVGIRATDDATPPSQRVAFGGNVFRSVRRARHRS